MSSLEPSVLVGRTITAATWDSRDLTDPLDKLRITFSDGCVIAIQAFGAYGYDADIDIDIVETRTASRP